jgi:hypothetical protein
MRPFSIKRSYMAKILLSWVIEFLSLISQRGEREGWIFTGSSGFAGPCPKSPMTGEG